MSYGITAYGHDSSISISSDIKSMVFMGKATRIAGTNLTYHLSDTPGNVYNTYRLQPAPTGHRDVRCSVSLQCNSSEPYLTAVFPNEVSIYTYYIDSPNIPIVFINSTNQYIFANVVGISNSGISGANGWTRWYFKICISYLNGLRDGALPSVNIYCFDKIHTNVTSGNGINIYDSSSTITFSSEYKPLKIKDVVKISGSSTPGSLDGIIYDVSYLTNPVQSAVSLSKAAFQNVDFGRYITSLSFGYTTCVSFNYFGNCVQCGTNYIHIKQMFINGGININSANNGLSFNLLSQDVLERKCSQGSPISGYVKNENFPIFIPVINGAEYD
jgi:hypothetical protein